MPVILAIILLAVSSFGISKSAQVLVNTIHLVSKRFRISDFTLGFFILGIATSTPEIFVGINSIIDGVPSLSLGNLIGGIIVLLTLLIGLSAIIFGKVNFKGTFTSKDFILTGFMLVSPAIVLFDGKVERYEGLLLVGFYIIFFFLMNKKETLIEHIRDKLTSQPIKSAKLLLKTLLSIVGLLIFSKIIVESALSFTSVLNISPLIVGLLMLSIGTNFPEITLNFFVKSDHKEIALGDILGSAAANVPLIGLLAIISPFEVDSLGKMRVSLIMLVIVVLIFSAFSYKKRSLSRIDGIILLGLYILFVVIEIINGH